MTEKQKQKKPEETILSPVIFISAGMPTILMNKENPQHIALQELGQFLQTFTFNSIILVSSEYIKPNTFHITNRDTHLSMQDHPYEIYYNTEYEAKGSAKISKEVHKKFNFLHFFLFSFYKKRFIRSFKTKE